MFEYKKAASEKSDATVFFATLLMSIIPLVQIPKYTKRILRLSMKCPSSSIIVGILACALGNNHIFLRLFSYLPSIPSGRLAPRTTNSCTYSNG